MVHKTLLALLLASLLLPAAAGAQSEIAVTPYDLGRAVIIDPELDDLAIDAPLQGAIALPADAEPAPLVIILHGRHAMCGVNISTYPCAPGEEIRYDLGYSYLLQALAEQGYAALAINLNPALTEAYGRGHADERAAQIVAHHLDALQAAAAGQEAGLPLQGRIDFSRIALIGHSSGGGAALYITRLQRYAVDALLLVAAAYNSLGSEGVERTGEELYAYYSTPSEVAVATILPDCDGDQIDFWSQTAYEAARLDPERTAFAASVRLFRANHNHFNPAVERGDRRFGYPPCFGETTDIMPRAEQEQFLSDYAAAFLHSVWGERPISAFDPSLLASNRLFGQRVETSLSLPAAQRQPIIFPQTADERTVNLLGGAVKPSNHAGILFCPPGDTCLAGITTMGRFGYLRLSYGARGYFRFELPEAYHDLSAYDVLHLRAAPDYTSTLNAPGVAAAFVVVLTDANGQESEVAVNGLSFQQIPAPAEYYAYEPFALYPASVRIPLGAFSRVDLTQIVSVTLRAADTSGTLLLADLELLRLHG